MGEGGHNTPSPVDIAGQTQPDTQDTAGTFSQKVQAPLGLLVNQGQNLITGSEEGHIGVAGIDGAAAEI